MNMYNLLVPMMLLPFVSASGVSTPPLQMASLKDLGFLLSEQDVDYPRWSYRYEKELENGEQA